MYLTLDMFNDRIFSNETIDELYSRGVSLIIRLNHELNVSLK